MSSRSAATAEARSSQGGSAKVRSSAASPSPLTAALPRPHALTPPPRTSTQDWPSPPSQQPPEHPLLFFALVLCSCSLLLFFALVLCSCSLLLFFALVL